MRAQAPGPFNAQTQSKAQQLAISTLSVLIKDVQDKMVASQSSNVSNDQNYPDEALA